MNPEPGDYIQLEGENHTTVSQLQWSFIDGTFEVTDPDGETYYIERYEEYDTQERRAWRVHV